MKTFKILTLSILIISTLTIAVNAETQQELNSRTLYKGSDITKAVETKYKAMNLSYFTENELNQAVQSDVKYFKSSTNAETKNENEDGSAVITTYQDNGKYIVVLGEKPTYVEPVKSEPVKIVEEIETPEEATIDGSESTSTDFQPRVVFDAQAEEKAKQEQYNSLFPLSGFWYLFKHYPLQLAGFLIVMFMCLIYLGATEIRNEEEGDKNDEN